MGGLRSSSMRYSNAEAGASFAPGWLANRLVWGAIVVLSFNGIGRGEYVVE